MFNMVPFERKSRGLQRSRGDFFDLDSIFESFFNDAVMPAFYNHSGQMRVDIRETENAYLVEAELPGVEKEDVHIDIAEDRLTISVQSKEVKEEETNTYVRRERRAHGIYRSFAINNVEADRISARMDNGILTVTLPKLELKGSATRKIDIQ